jgi:hypothetical protein
MLQLSLVLVQLTNLLNTWSCMVSVSNSLRNTSIATCDKFYFILMLTGNWQSFPFTFKAAECGYKSSCSQLVSSKQNLKILLIKSYFLLLQYIPKTLVITCDCQLMFCIQAWSASQNRLEHYTSQVYLNCIWTLYSLFDIGLVSLNKEYWTSSKCSTHYINWVLFNLT